MFFSFDGIDGVGKTTQMELFCAWLRERGAEVVTCRDPGSTSVGEAVREILLNRPDLAISRRCEMLLYMAARAQLVAEVIAPALEQGKAVVSDRFLLANVVYQGHAGGLDTEDIWTVGRVAINGFLPDLIFLLDMDSDAARGRLNRPLDRMELQGEAFRRGLRAGFQAEAARQPELIRVVDAAQPIDVVQAQIRAAAAEVLARKRFDTQQKGQPV